MESIKQIQSKQCGSSVSIEKDALTQLFGQDDRGRIRGIGSRVSRTHALIVEQVHAIQDMKKIKKQTKKAKKSGKMENIEKRLDNIEAMISFSSKQSSLSFDTNQPSALPSHSPPPHVPSTHVSSPQVSSQRKYKIRSTIDYGRFIGQGRGSSQPTPRPVLDIERKISVDLVYEGMKSEQLYLGSQGCYTTFGEVQGGFVAWNAYLLDEIKD